MELIDALSSGQTYVRSNAVGWGDVHLQFVAAFPGFATR